SKEAAVHCPESKLEQTLFPFGIGNEDTQADQHQSDSEHAVYAEQRRMTVKRGRVQSLHVIQGYRRIDHETEQAGSHHVPEGDSDEEVDRPAISRGPCRQPAPAEVVHCCVRDHDQGHNLECAERSSEGQCDSGRSTEIEMMSSADD